MYAAKGKEIRVKMLVKYSAQQSHSSTGFKRFQENIELLVHIINMPSKAIIC